MVATRFLSSLGALAPSLVLGALGLWGCGSLESGGRRSENDQNGQTTQGTGSPSERDSDGDYLTNDEEASLGTDPNDPDSDGDGYSDFVEVRGLETDPNDAESKLPTDAFFLELPYKEDRENRKITVTFDPRIRIADVFLLVDATGSMREERDNLIDGIVDIIVPGVQAEIPNVQMGAGGYADYPIVSYGNPIAIDSPFFLLRKIAPADEDIGEWKTPWTGPFCGVGIGSITGTSNGRVDILEAVEGLPCLDGLDLPESVVPALWTTATGQALTWMIDDDRARMLAGETTASAACPAGHQGMPCFRPRAFPIILTFGDAPFHNGPANENQYGADVPNAPTYTQAADALGKIGARVIGIASKNDPFIQQHYQAIARDTGAIDASGTPFFFQIREDGTGLSKTVVEAVKSLVNSVPLDVTTRLENLPGNPDDFDATMFIKSITPEKYEDVVPGTPVEFVAEFHNDVRPPAEKPEFFKARIVLIGDGITELDARTVYILVPPNGPTTELK